MSSTETQTITEQHFKAAQFAYIQEQSVVSTAAYLIAVGIVALFALVLRDKTDLYLWLAVVGMGSFINVLCWQWFYRRYPNPLHETRISVTGPLLSVSLGFSGLVWTAATLLFVQEPNDTMAFCIILIILGISSAGIASLGPYKPCYIAYVAGSFIGLIWQYYAFGVPIVSLMFAIYLIALILLGIKFGAIVSNGITISLEKEALLQQVTLSRNAAEKANLDKSNFLAAASHDLRQPLQAMGLLLEALETRFNTQNDSNRRLLEQTLHSHETLSALFNSLMELSQLDSGAIIAKLDNVNADELLHSICDEFTPAARAKNLTIHREWQPAYVKADPILLNRIIRNLVSNAVKFTHKGSISVAMHVKDKQVHISVKDTGMGIDHKNLALVFDEYYQLNNQERDQRKGVGLGLSVVKKMTAIMGATINVQSKVGEGTEFILTCVQGTCPAAPMPVEEHSSDTFSAHVLLIDDEPNVLEALKLSLESWHCQVTAVASLADIQQTFDWDTIDLVITDYRLKEGLTGINAIHNLRNSANRNIPALIITGDTDPTLIKSIREQGFFVLHKPVKSTHLRKVMRQLLTMRSI